MKSVRKTILVADDEPDIVLATAAILQDAGYSVASATQREGLMQRLSQDSLPDLILLDMLLSGQRGTEITEELKQSQSTRHIPAYPHPDILGASRCRAGGAHGGR